MEDQRLATESGGLGNTEISASGLRWRMWGYFLVVGMS